MTNSLKVWSKFSVKKKGGTFLNLKIVDMPEYLGDKVINLYIDYFVKQENTFIAAGKFNLDVTQLLLGERMYFVLGLYGKKKELIIKCCEYEQKQ